MRSKFLALAMILLFSGVVAGQSTGVELSPGLAEPGDPLYQVEQVVDPFPLNPGEKASERASEMVIAQEKNLSQAQEFAERSFNQSVERAKERSGNKTLQGLQKAQQVLEQNMERTPDQANKGLEKALSNVREAQDRVREGIENRTGQEIPDSPGNAPDRDVGR